MMRLPLVVVLILLSACGSSDSTGPSVNIAGSYTLQSANLHALPAPGKLPNYGKVQILSGSVTIDDDSLVNLAVIGATNGGVPVATVTFQQTGFVTGSGRSYTFELADGTNAAATCTSSTCDVAYDGNSFVFGKQ
jgi:hypothetical protein